ncbi:MAG: VOC family protein [Eubacteriales bacterium]|nr:VOC family protein [Eubacteriales bacterium]
MKFMTPLLVVRDMARSKAFYTELLGLEIVTDLGANVTLTGGIALQTLESWQGFIEKEEISFGGGCGELYFETFGIEEFAEKCAEKGVPLVHPLKEHGWGQRVIRIYDPDGHILEIGEAMPAVVQRFLDSGMSIEQVAQRMGIPLEYLTQPPQG